MCRESGYVDGCDYFQLDVHYKYVFDTSSFGFTNLGVIVCLFGVMLIQFVVYLAVAERVGMLMVVIIFNSMCTINMFSIHRPSDLPIWELLFAYSASC